MHVLDYRQNSAHNLTMFFFEKKEEHNYPSLGIKKQKKFTKYEE